MHTGVLQKLIFALIFFLIGPAEAHADWARPNWDRALAAEVLESNDTSSTLASLFQAVRERDEAHLLATIDEIRRDETLAAPVVDYLMFEFAVNLGEMEPGSVSPEVLAELESYTPRTLVPHDDNAAAGVPMFNVRAAVAGARSAWRWQLSVDRALSLLQGSPEAWIDAYLAADAAERRGFMAAMDLAPETEVNALGAAASTRLPGQPSLMAVVAGAGTRLDDLEWSWQAIAQGNADDLPAVLRQLAATIDAPDCLVLLQRSLRLDSDVKAALAMAELGPAALAEPEAVETLMTVLGDPELGSGAALVLSGSDDTETQQKLQRLASKNEGLAARRAALAIDLQRSRREVLQ